MQIVYEERGRTGPFRCIYLLGDSLLLLSCGSGGGNRGLIQLLLVGPQNASILREPMGLKMLGGNEFPLRNSLLRCEFTA